MALKKIKVGNTVYDIGGADESKVNLTTPFTSNGEIVIAEDTTGVKGSGVQVSDLATKSDLNNLATKSDLDDLTTTSEVNTAISNSLTGAVSTIKTSNLTASRVLISDSSGKVAASSSVTTTELGYLDGVTSSIQTQLNTINTNVGARPTQAEVESLIEDFVTFGENPSTYTVEAISGVTYGFTLGSDGYYASTNKSNDTFSLCKVVFNLTEVQNIVVSCYQSSESGYDYGILSTLDKTLASNATADSTNVFASHKGLSGNTTTTYSNVSAGEHFIYIKYRKDGSQSNGSDVFKFKIEPLTGSVNTNIITDGTNTLDLSEVGHGVEIIDITDLDAIPEEYQDFEKLKTCYLQSGSLIYRLSYDGTGDDSGLYYENSDELYYNYLRIKSNFDIENNPDAVGDKYIATQDWVNASKQDKLTAGRNIQITEDGIIGIANPNNCKVVSELPTPTVELANEETIYSYDGKLYNIVYNPEDPSDIHYQQLTYGDASFNPYFKDKGLVLDELADEEMSGGMWVYTPVRGE